jgi:hypothetical protein
MPLHNLHRDPNTGTARNDSNRSLRSCHITHGSRRDTVVFSIPTRRGPEVKKKALRRLGEQ